MEVKPADHYLPYLLSPIMVKLAVSSLRIMDRFTRILTSIKTDTRIAQLLGGMIVILALVGCSSKKSVVHENYSDLYKAQEIKIRNDYTIFHQETNLTTFYLRIAAADLKYVKSPDELKTSATAVIELKAFPADPAMRRAVDSIVVRLNGVEPGNEHTFLHTAVNLNLPDGYKFRTVLKVTDINSGKSQNSTFTVDKTSINGRENFLVFQTDKRLPIYRNYITRPGRLRIKNNRSKDMTVRYYKRFFPLPPPPFSTYSPPPFQYEADSIYTLRATPDFSILEANESGFYHITVDDDQKNGYTLFTFPEPFPYVGTTQQMFEAIRYLTTEWEYREMKQKGNLREAVEQYWLDFAGSKNKAREMIELYYSRVEEANQFFSSYIEGWKSDRGLIHIVYGPPNVIYKGSNSETWIYGEDKNVMSLTFTFVKVINPFTDNDYRLNRDENFKASWYRAIESWRNGRIYAN